MASAHDSTEPLAGTDNETSFTTVKSKGKKKARGQAIPPTLIESETVEISKSQNPQEVEQVQQATGWGDENLSNSNSLRFGRPFPIRDAWICIACKAENFPYRNVCHRRNCQAPRPSTTAQTEGVDGDKPTHKSSRWDEINGNESHPESTSPRTRHQEQSRWPTSTPPSTYSSVVTPNANWAQIAKGKTQVDADISKEDKGAKDDPEKGAHSTLLATHSDEKTPVRGWTCPKCGTWAGQFKRFCPKAGCKTSRPQNYEFHPKTQMVDIEVFCSDPPVMTIAPQTNVDETSQQPSNDDSSSSPVLSPNLSNATIAKETTTERALSNQPPENQAASSSPKVPLKSTSPAFLPPSAHIRPAPLSPAPNQLVKELLHAPLQTESLVNPYALPTPPVNPIASEPANLPVQTPPLEDIPPLVKVDPRSLPPMSESVYMWQRILTLADDMRQYNSMFRGPVPPALSAVLHNYTLLLRQFAGFLYMNAPIYDLDDPNYLLHGRMLATFAQQLMHPIPFHTPLPEPPRWMVVYSNIANTSSDVRQQRPLVHECAYQVARWGTPLVNRPITALPANEAALVANAWNRSASVAMEQAQCIEGIPLSYFDLARLNPAVRGANSWLNDNVIDAYLQLMCTWMATTQLPVKPSRCLAMTSHFIPKLTRDGFGYDFEAVSTWTSRALTWSYDKIFIPVHRKAGEGGKDSHWLLIVANLQRHQFEVVDTLDDFSAAERALAPIIRWLGDELNITGANTQRAGRHYELPPQRWAIVRYIGDPSVNASGDDCGVFVCRAAVLRALNQEFDFSGRDLDVLRERIAWELLQGKLDVAIVDARH